jgi:hypothetical protein
MPAQIDGKLRQDVIELVWKFGQARCGCLESEASGTNHDPSCSQVNRFSFGAGREKAFQLLTSLWRRNEPTAAS